MKEGITVSGLSFSYDGVNDVLKDIDIDIPKKGIFGLIGPNGAGKTTMLKMISGYLKPAAGCVYMDGRDVRSFGVREMARHMALVPQFSQMEYDFTVKDIVITGRHPHISRIRGETFADFNIADEAMRYCGIEYLKNRSVLGLSGGEWQRMIIARAVCQQSDILLLDEPVSHLDIRHQADILNMVKSLTDEKGLTAIAVLHDLSLIYNYCDNVTMLDCGRVYGRGRPEEVITKKGIEEVYGITVNIEKIGESTYVLPKYSFNN